jgi:predicted O-methyltransferase YrrM
MNASAMHERFCGEWSDIVDHLPALHDVALGASVVLELGVRGGRSSAAFLAALEQGDGELWSVDVAGQPFEHERWHFVQGDDRDVADALPEAVDVLFIDTSHHYGHTLQELDLYGHRVRPGGVIVCHDTELERPDGAPADDPAFPVSVALDEWCEANGLSWVNTPGCNGLGTVRIPKREGVTA